MRVTKHETRNTKHENAMTLIEFIMVIVVVGILTGITSMYIKETIDLWRFLSFRNEIVSQGRMALGRMVMEIRQIKDNLSIQTATSSELEFTDIDDNSVHYTLSTTDLMRNSDVLAGGVSNLTFCYYDVNNQSVCSPADACSCSSIGDTSAIYRIGIELDISSGSQSKHLETQVYPSNL